MLIGHAEEYSKLVLGSITGCSPTTPIPLPWGKQSTEVTLKGIEVMLYLILHGVNRKKKVIITTSKFQNKDCQEKNN